MLVRTVLIVGARTGKEGAGPKEGMSEALDDTKAALDAAAGQSL